MYDNVQTRVRFGEVLTGWLPMERLVQQDCVLSPLLFALYTRGLSGELEASGQGVKVVID